MESRRGFFRSSIGKIHPDFPKLRISKSLYLRWCFIGMCHQFFFRCVLSEVHVAQMQTFLDTCCVPGLMKNCPFHCE